MLERDVHIPAHLGIGGHFVQDVLREIGRIGVMDTEPLNAVYLGKLTKELRQAALSVNIQAVIGGVLGPVRQGPWLLSPASQWERTCGRHV